MTEQLVLVAVKKKERRGQTELPQRTGADNERAREERMTKREAELMDQMSDLERQLKMQRKSDLACFPDAGQPRGITPH
jgi:hypothetical protein